MIRIDGPDFKDEHGRTLHAARGQPGRQQQGAAAPDGATHLRAAFFDHRDVSFVGRPFPLEEADEHFSRLSAWGFTFLRLLVTWEAIEHAGPGLYDEAYLDYVYSIAQKAGEHGLNLFIDPHQDVWSRFSGGDGAPGWTLEAVGFDLPHFAETGAAIVHATHGDPFPKMIWPTNGSKLAAATMFTLFFGGNDFAPQTCVDGEPVQEFLQRHFIAAIQQVALRLQDLPHVVGYDPLNEPLPGYIGWKDSERGERSRDPGTLPDPLPGDAARRRRTAGRGRVAIGGGQPPAVRDTAAERCAAAARGARVATACGGRTACGTSMSRARPAYCARTTSPKSKDGRSTSERTTCCRSPAASPRRSVRSIPGR